MKKWFQPITGATFRESNCFEMFLSIRPDAVAVSFRPIRSDVWSKRRGRSLRSAPSPASVGHAAMVLMQSY
jgi:hypothetical protein